MRAVSSQFAHRRRPVFLISPGRARRLSPVSTQGLLHPKCPRSRTSWSSGSSDPGFEILAPGTHHPEKGFSASAQGTPGADSLLPCGPLCTARCRAASPDSTHRTPLALPPRPCQAVTPNCPDTDKYTLGGRAAPTERPCPTWGKSSESVD